MPWTPKLPIRIVSPNKTRIIRTEIEFFRYWFRNRIKSYQIRRDRIPFDIISSYHLDPDPDQISNMNRRQYMDETWVYSFLYALRTYLRAIGCNNIQHGLITETPEIIDIMIGFYYNYNPYFIRIYEMMAKNRRLNQAIRSYRVVLEGIQQPYFKYQWANTMPDLAMFLKQLQIFHNSMNIITNAQGYPLLGLVNGINEVDWNDRTTNENL